MRKDLKDFKINDVVDVYYLMKPRRMYACTAQIRQFVINGGKTFVSLVGIGGVWDVEQIEHTKRKEEGE